MAVISAGFHTLKCRICSLDEGEEKKKTEEEEKNPRPKVKWLCFKQMFVNSSKARFQTCLLLMLFYKRMWLKDSSLLLANIFSFTLSGKFSKH